MNLHQALPEYVVTHRERLFAIVQDLVRCPSENKPPVGAEGKCQQYIASRLRASGYDTELYELTDVAGLDKHPLFVPGRDYHGRPNLVARRKGCDHGRSLILSGHIDTVPSGTQRWSRDPFSGHMEGNRLYGRGSNDMKGGVGMGVFVMEALAELNIRLAGDVTFETIIDEEFGGVNGTIAGRVRGHVADAAVVLEPSFLRICAAQRGGRTVHITFSAPGGVLTEGAFPVGVIDQLRHFLNALKDFADQRRHNCRPHPLYAHHCDPVPVSVTKIFTAPWGTGEPITTPEECKVELYWQLMPGETQTDVEQEFTTWFDSMLASAPELFTQKPAIEYPIRWMPGSAISVNEPVVRELTAAAESVMHRPPPVAGIEGPCDMFVFHEFGIPAVLWGPRGGNTHAADEYVELDSVVTAAQALLLFVCQWCGVAETSADVQL